jgi:quinol monooxygenase YgiN
MIVVVGTFRLPVETLDAARAAMARVIAASRAEPGCRAYAYAEDLIEPGLLRVNEAWDSRAALDAHLAMPHMAQWRGEREALGLYDRDITVYAVSGEAKL